MLVVFNIRGGGLLIQKNLSKVAVTETHSSNVELGTHLSTCLKAEKKTIFYKFIKIQFLRYRRQFSCPL
jgi:hypothetical protein